MNGASGPMKASWKDDLRAELFEHLRARSFTPGQAIALICLADYADFHTGENARPSIATLAANADATEAGGLRFGERRGFRPGVPESHWQRSVRQRARAKRVQFSDD